MILSDDGVAFSVVALALSAAWAFLAVSAMLSRARGCGGEQFFVVEKQCDTELHDLLVEAANELDREAQAIKVSYTISGVWNENEPLALDTYQTLTALRDRLLRRADAEI